jgi:sugar (pentulose or hexulose) kinase
MTITLGVDLATANARVLAVDEGGEVLAEREAALPGVLSPEPGVREQRAAYLPTVLDLLAAVAADLGDRATDVAALCLTGTSGTLVPCDASGRPTGPALLYSDQSSAREAARLRAAGIPATPTSPMARIGHLVREGAALVLHTPDVVHAGLLGHVAPADTSHALKSGVDPVARTWDTAALEALEVPVGALPELVHPGTVLGTLAPEVAARTGLPAGTQVVAGMTDGCTAQVATGAVGAGDSVGVLGTTLVLKAVADHEVRGLDGALYSHLGPDGSWWSGGASNVGARPVADEFGGTDARAIAALEAEAAPAPAAASLSYPLRGTGERFPFAHPGATGFTLGREGSAYRTFLEGVAYVERLGLEVLADHGVRPELHHLAGGAARSELWSRIRATVLELPVVRSRHTASGYGAALLALATVTRTALPDLVARVLPTDPDDVVDPLEDERERLRDGYGRLREELHRRGLLDPTPDLDPDRRIA